MNATSESVPYSKAKLLITFLFQKKIKSLQKLGFFKLHGSPVNTQVPRKEHCKIHFGNEIYFAFSSKNSITRIFFSFQGCSVVRVTGLHGR
jgi:hypothetical protein